MIIRSKEANTGKTIFIEEKFRAPKEQVFRAWTSPDSLKKWFMADEGVIVNSVEINLQVEGTYYIKTTFPGYAPSSIEGVFLSVDAPKTLEYTWTTPVLKGKFTKVNVTFLDEEKGSKIHLSHGEFNDEQEMKLHIDGWKGCIGQLHKFLSSDLSH